MRTGLAVILGGLLVCLASGTSFASELTSPNPRSSSSLPSTVGNPTPPAAIGYTLNESLIGRARETVEQTENPDIEIETKKDLTAVSIKTETSFTPYVGAGVATAPEAQETPGVSDFEAAKEAERQDYRLGAGLGCELSKVARLDLGYRYSNENLTLLPSTQPGTAETDAAGDHHISVGLKMAF